MQLSQWQHHLLQLSLHYIQDIYSNYISNIWFQCIADPNHCSILLGISEITILVALKCIDLIISFDIRNGMEKGLHYIKDNC